MNTEKTYQYEGLLTIKRSCVLKGDTLPKDEVVSWLFLVMDKIGEKRYTFFYKIIQPVEAFYGVPFNILMSFLMDGLNEVIEINRTYDVWRGEEFVGNVKIIKMLK